MANNQIITVEFKADTDEFLKKVEEVFKLSTNTLSSITSTVMKLSKGYSEMGKIETFFKEANKMVTQFSNSMRKTEKKGVHGFERIKKVIAGTTKETKLAKVASEAFKFALSPVGLTAIAAGLILIGKAFHDMFTKESNAVKTAKEHTQALKDQKTEWDKMQKSSNDSLETSLAQSDLAKKYSEDLIKLSKCTELTAEDQNRMNFLVERLNELLPNAGLYIDEETGKLASMNGAVDDLEGSLKNLIEAQKAQAYLDAYKDDYAEALRSKNELMKEQAILYDQIQDKQAKVNAYEDKAKELAGKYGYGSSEYEQGMNELFKATGMTAKDYETMKLELSALNDEYTAGQEILKGYTDQVKNFEDMQEAMFNQDWDKVHQIMNGMGEVELFSEEKGKAQIDSLQAQYQELKKIKNALNEMQENDQTVDTDYLDSVNEQLKLAEDQLLEYYKHYKEDAATTYSEVATTSGEILKETLNEKVNESGTAMINQMTADAQTGIDGINTVIASTLMNAVIVPVIYKAQNSPSAALGTTVSMIGASYDDFIENPSMFTPFSSDASYFMAQARNTMQSLQSRLARGLVSMPVFETKLAGAGNKQVDVNQTNVFNVPVQKPSDVTRAIEKMNRELAKRL